MIVPTLTVTSMANALADAHVYATRAHSVPTRLLLKTVVDGYNEHHIGQCAGFVCRKIAS
jgi:hypothetical protein